MSFVSSRKGFNLNKISLLRKELIATLPFALKAAAFFSHVAATAASVYGLVLRKSAHLTSESTKCH